MYCMIIHHPLTDVSLLLNEQNDSPPKIFEIILGQHSRGAFRPIPVAWLTNVTFYSRQIIAFLDCRQKDLDQIPLDLGRFSEFQRTVLLTCRGVPWGSVISYRDLARLARSGHAVRAAATVMRKNPFPLVIPCHRVVRNDGAIGGFMGAETGEAIELKRKLLQREGITI
jgi:methylated-DNA-[protein]-cysteine S-methyltransferase